MPNLPPYRYHEGEIPEQLSRWLELARQCIIAAGGNVDTGQIGASLYLCRSVDLDRDVDVAFPDTDFDLTLQANSAFALEGALKFIAGAGGIRFNINGPIDGNYHWAVTDPGTALTTENNARMVQDVTVPVISDEMVVEFSGLIRTGAVPVNFKMSWAQETANVTPLTLAQGSWIRLTRTKDVQLVPPAPIVLTITPAPPLDQGFKDIAYPPVQFVAAGGTPPYAWSLASGSLPTGMTLSGTGLLSGTPTAIGIFNFTVQAVDGFLGIGTQAYSIGVKVSGNEYDPVLLGASHYWPMDEASGDYLDAVGSLDLNLGAGAATDAWRLAPLLGPRGTPRAYGLWKPNNALPRPRNLGGPATSGWTSGGMGCWFRMMEIDATPMSLMSCTWLDNSGLVMQLSVETDGRLRFECDGAPRIISIQTAASFVVPGQLYYVHVEQPADGGGLIMYVDGVDQSLATSLVGGATNDSYPDDVMSGFGANPTHTQFGGVAGAGFDGSWMGVVGGGYINRNVAFSPADIAQLADAVNQTQPADDFHEWVADLGWPDNSLIVWVNGNYLGANDQGMSGGLGSFEPRGSSFSVGPSIENDPDNAGANLQIESDYARFKQVYGTNNPTYFAIAGNTNMEPTAAKKRGSIIATVTISSVPNGIRKIINTFGTTATNSMEFGVIGSTLGWQVFFRAFVSSVEVYRVLSGIVQLGGTWFGDIAVVQDGGGPVLYVDGVKMSAAPVIETDPAVWWHTYGDASGQRYGGEQGSASVDNWQPGHLHNMEIYTKMLSPVQFLEHRNAVDGNVVGPTFSSSIEAFIDSLNPTHRYKLDDVSGNLVDSGSVGGVDMVPVGTLLYEQGGPDDSTESVDGNTGTDFAAAASSWGAHVTGTVVFLVKNVSSSVTLLCHSNTVNEVNTMAFGVNPQGGGTVNLPGATMSLSSFSNRRQWEGDDSVASWNGDNVWHVMGFVQDGVGMRINTDGRENTVGELTNGTPPGSGAWFSAVEEANSRAVAYNARVATASGNHQGQLCEILVFDGVELTEAQFQELTARITNFG